MLDTIQYTEDNIFVMPYKSVEDKQSTTSKIFSAITNKQNLIIIAHIRTL